MAQSEYDGRLRAAFQLAELRQAVCTAREHNPSLSDAYSLGLYALRVRRSQLRAHGDPIRFLWVAMLILDIKRTGSFRKVRGRLLSELREVDVTPDGNTGVNLANSVTTTEGV